MNTIYAKYNMYHNSIDIYTSAGYMLRIDCNKAEDGLKATPRSQYSLYALAAFQRGSGINNLSSDYFDRVGGGFRRRPLTPPDMRFRIRRFS